MTTPSPSNEQIAQAVTRLVIDHVAALGNDDPPVVAPTSSFIDDLGLDPLDIDECIAKCDVQFDISLQHDALSNPRATVADLIAIVVIAVCMKARADA